MEKIHTRYLRLCYSIHIAGMSSWNHPSTVHRYVVPTFDDLTQYMVILTLEKVVTHHSRLMEVHNIKIITVVVSVHIYPEATAWTAGRTKPSAQPIHQHQILQDKTDIAQVTFSFLVSLVAPAYSWWLSRKTFLYKITSQFTERHKWISNK